MGKRREAREAALQVLYAHDLRPSIEDVEQAEFWKMRPAEHAVRESTTSLVNDILEKQNEIDAVIENAAANYKLSRITAVDRNILRIAIYEMLFESEIPPVVSINEAIEIAKRFGTEESGRFVNGILDRIKADLDRPLREPAPSQGAE